MRQPTCIKDMEKQKVHLLRGPTEIPINGGQSISQIIKINSDSKSESTETQKAPGN